jgi:hypothetical protein
MLESNNAEIWNAKIDNIGVLYSVGTLLWSFITWILLAVFVAIGIDVIRSRDKSMPD